MSESELKHWARVAVESENKDARQLAVTTLLIRALSLSRSLQDRGDYGLTWLDGGEA